MKISISQQIRIEDYNYNLPDEKIAKYPLPVRDQSRLLVYRQGNIQEDTFLSIDNYLPDNSLLVYNNTRVIQARIRFQKATGAQVEIFCLEPYLPHDYNLIFQSAGKCSWICMVGNLKKWKESSLEKEIIIHHTKVMLTVRKVGMQAENHIIEFKWDNPSVTFADLLEVTGELPIPPYLNRGTEENDKTTYQTVYSKVKGSVAAPTAGLHFTPEVFDKLKSRGIVASEVTLHVGAGTFKPVKAETIGEHTMHSEFIAVTKKTILQLLNHTGKIVAVGTTSVRALESLYHIGVLLQNNNSSDIKVSQWQAYEKQEELPVKKALENILNYLDKNKLDVLLADTCIMIVPGYQFRLVNGIITNFHQPKSTLLLLVSAFVKGNWKSIYEYALTHNFRFLSYGDSSLLLD